MSDLAVLAKDMDFSDADIQHMLENLDSFNADELAEIDKIVDELSVRNKNKDQLWLLEVMERHRFNQGHGRVPLRPGSWKG